MKRWKGISWFIGIPALVVLLIMIILLSEPERNGISRAAAYKAAALSMTTMEDCQNQEELETSYFQEKDRGQWYIKYMDYLYREGLLSEELTPADAKTAESWLTFEEADDLASRISPELAAYIRISPKNKKKHIPQEQWWLLYDEILRITDPERVVTTVNLMIYGTPLNVEGASPWIAYTNEGVIGFEGLSLDSYIDKEIQAVLRGGELIRIARLVSEEVIYPNVWILSADKEEVNGYVGSITRTFKTLKQLKKPDEMENMLGDLYISNGKLKKIVLKKEKISGKVLEVKEDSIEIEGYGKLMLDQNFNVYRLYGELKRQSMSDILVGYDVQEFVVADGKLCAALTMREAEAQVIRVLIMNTGFHSLFHDSITLQMKSPTVLIADDREEKLNAGDALTISVGDTRLKNGRIILKPDDEYQGISLSSIERSMGVPSYPGRIEISQEPEGLVLVNELYLEDYLKRVIPSEMPASYEKEALKAQAICARTYAYRQILGNSYRQFGAHVNDSTRFQVYNNTETEARTDQAVNETYGKLLSYQGVPMDAYYFSTSSGHTTDGTIWGADLSSVPYLKGVAVKEGGGSLDLTLNDQFSEFIKNKTYAGYESAFGFYRWETSITNTQLEQKVTDVGTITKVAMKERGTGGIGKTLIIEGTKGTRTITGEGQIRSVLGNTELVIQKNDGKTLTGWSTLPSAFISIEKVQQQDSQESTFLIYGGGYGHGVGMSQNGAQGMAKVGKSYKQILNFFYDGVEIQDRAAAIE